MSDSIQVAIKVRPLIKRERDENLQVQWSVVNNVIVPVDPEKRRGENGFQFDHIFDPTKTNSDVFETVVQPIVDAAVKGFNGTVFAYGQTSSGKTHTMLGTSSELGVIPLAVERMFDAISETCGREFLLRVSYLEIYNEKVNDLLESKSVDLKLREDSNGLVQVINCKEEIASSPELIMSIMKKGDKNRRIGETDMNERSSRSHTIFRITIESREQTEDSDGAVQVSQLNLVDLAGSERARQTNATGERFKEGTHINMSLSTLGLVIKQLSESSDNTKYVNFRDSKLTRLLQASLGGNAMTAIICAVTPAAFEETQCTLWFASRAKSVKNKPQLNEVMSDAALLKRYKKQLAKLLEELEKLKNEKGIPEVQEMESKLQEKEHILQERDRQNQMLEERIELLKNSIVCTGSLVREDNNSKIPKSKRRRTWAGTREQSNRFSLGFRNLPTIIETSSNFPDSKSNSNENLDKIRRRKSIIQSVNLNEQSFETAFTDFELELIKVAKEREQQTGGTEFINEKSENKVKSRTVKFEDDVEIYRFSNGSCTSDMSTPEKLKAANHNDTCQESPGTPKSILRERLNYLTDEYNELQEFTTLERQILSAQSDFNSPNEKLLMQNQIDELLRKLHKCNMHQTELKEQLIVSVDCINELRSITPDILESWRPLLSNDENQTYIELKRLLEMLKSFKNEQNETTKALSPLEKKLSDDYNECLKELEQVKLQKDQLLKENNEMKNKLSDESNKLKNTLDHVNTLKIDTDCLMEKLIQKNSELAKLKEKVVELERMSSEMEKSVSTSFHEVSIKKDNDAKTSVKSNSNLNQNKDDEISKLNEVIEEKSHEISKYRQFEEEMKLENERLQQALDDVLKIEHESIECQTELVAKLDNDSKDAQIIELSKIIEEKTSNITYHQQLEIEMKQKIEELTLYVDTLNNKGVITQESQTELTVENKDENNSLDQQQQEEISKLSHLIQEKSSEIVQLLELNSELNKKIDLLQSTVNVSTTEPKLKTSEALDISNKEYNYAHIEKEKDPVMSRLEDIIQQKDFEIVKYKQLEEEMLKEIKNLQLQINQVENTTTECQTTNIHYDASSGEPISNDLKQCTNNKIVELLEVIEIKSSEIKKYQESEEGMKKEISRLQQCIDNLEKVSENTNDPEQSSEKCIRSEAEQEKDNEISRLKEVIGETTLELENYKQEQEKLKSEIQLLQSQISDSINSSSETLVAIQTEHLSSENNATLETNDYSNQSEIIRLQILEIEKYKQVEEELKKQILILQSNSNNIKVDQISKECQIDFPSDNMDSNSDLNEKENQITKLLEIIKNKDFEIESLKSSEEENKKKLCDLLQQLQSTTDCDELPKNLIDNENHKINTQEIEIEKLNKILQEQVSEIMNYKESEKKLKEELESLRKHLNSTVQEEKVDNEPELHKKSESYQEEIATLNHQITVLATTNQELLAKVSSLDIDLTNKIKELEELNSCNTVLQHTLDEKIREISNLNRVFDSSVKELEEKLSILILERNELKNKIDFSDLIDTEKEMNNLKNIIEELKLENKSLKEYIQSLEVECNKTNVLTPKMSLLTSPAKSNSIESMKNISSSVESSNVQPNKKESVYDNVEAETNKKSIEECEFIKPETVAKSEMKESKPAIVDKNLVKIQIKKSELESSSIFANMSYFDAMEVGQSFMHDGTSIFTAIDETKDISNLTTNVDVSMANQESENKCEINSKVIIDGSNDAKKLEITQSFSLDKTNTESYTLEELKNIKIALEKENAILLKDLQSKIQETEEIQKYVIDFKQTLEKLQQTIDTLTDENMNMSKQLTEAKESNDQIVYNFQSEIDTLTANLTKVTEEKLALKNEYDIISEHLENMRATTPVSTDDEIKNKFFEYQERIKSLTDENIELSTNLMKSIEELEKVKDSKIQDYDHECTYREKSDLLLEKVQRLENENIELSNDITEQIEECDKLKETVDVLKAQLENYAKQSMTENADQTDTEFLRNDNKRLINELIEMRTKVTQLSRENANLSHVILDNSDEHDQSISSENKSVSTMVTGTEVCTENINETLNASFMNKKVKNLQEQVEHLTLLNKKLTALKLPNCSQCIHLKELNDSRRQLKLEVKSLNQKLMDLQKKFQQKCIDTEVLRTKANDDFNASLSLLDSTLNSSNYDAVNVTMVEEKIRNLHGEMEELKENHNKLANQYQEKCNELETLQLDNNSIEKKERRSKADGASRKTSSRIQTLQKDLEHFSNELKELKKSNTNISTTLHKFMSDRSETMELVESLKLTNENLKKECSTSEAKALNCEEKIKLLEEELGGLYKQIEISSTLEKEIKAQKLDIEVQVESLLKEKSELITSLQNYEEKIKRELEDHQLLAFTHEKETTDLKHELLKLEDVIANNNKENTNLKNELQKLEDATSIYEKENTNLKNELQQLEDIIQKLKESNNNYLTDKLQEEIDTTKLRIMKETKSLINLSDKDLKELKKKSVTDIFESFLNASVSRHIEVFKRLQEDSKKKEQKLEETIQQTIDAEKRANVWAKTLETDLEKLQSDLTELERKYRNLEDKNRRLEDHSKEIQHENQQLLSKFENLEFHCNSLQNELENKSKLNVDRDSALTAAQEREKLIKKKEEEWEQRFLQEREEHRKELKELNDQLDSYKSIKDELKITIEGLDHEIQHLTKTNNNKKDELNAAKCIIEELKREVERMEELNQQLKNEILEKNKHIDEITDLLKIRCDLLTEYKTKVETMKPEFESMQAQISERKICIERYKEEIQCMKLENKKHLDVLQDKLSDEEIKSTGLSKQLNELKNKNTALCSTVEELKDRCTELEIENSNLQRKVRNSTSKIRVENEMQELQDENRSLKNNLEGSYNRIKELQESKSQVQRDLAEAQGKNELLEQELNTTQVALNSLREKYNNVNVQKLREKYETVLREKTNIVREIEEKRMLIASKDQKLVEYSIELDTVKKQKEMLNIEIDSMSKEKILLEEKIYSLVEDNEKLKKQIEMNTLESREAYNLIVVEKNKIACDLDEIIKKNKELDEEMDDMVTHVHKLESENAELFDKIITGSSSENLDKIKNLEDENEKLKIDRRVAEVKRSQLEKEIIRLNTEKDQLLGRIEDLNSKYAELESKLFESKTSSRNSSKSNSPTSRKGRRRQRRSDMFNLSRNLEFDNESRDMTDTESPSGTPIPPAVAEECQMCNDLRNRIREMSLDIASRNNKITMLEVQLQSENFPYQVKYNELQRTTLALKTKNSELKSEIQKLQRALMEDSSRECQICRQKKLNKRDQSVQVKPEDKIYLSGMSSGVVEDHLKFMKMEKDINFMKEVCRGRAKRIKDLEQRIKELEGLKTVSFL